MVFEKQARWLWRYQRYLENLVHVVHLPIPLGTYFLLPEDKIFQIPFVWRCQVRSGKKNEELHSFAGLRIFFRFLFFPESSRFLAIKETSLLFSINDFSNRINRKLRHTPHGNSTFSLHGKHYHQSSY